MEKEHFELLLERIEDNTKLALEGVSTANHRLERQEERLARLEAGQAKLEAGQAKLEAGQVVIQRDIREIKTTVGLLHSIANDHETRLRRLEGVVEDHLAEHLDST